MVAINYRYISADRLFKGIENTSVNKLDTILLKPKLPFLQKTGGQVFHHSNIPPFSHSTEGDAQSFVYMEDIFGQES